MEYSDTYHVQGKVVQPTSGGTDTKRTLQKEIITKKLCEEKISRLRNDLMNYDYNNKKVAALMTQKK